MHAPRLATLAAGLTAAVLLSGCTGLSDLGSSSSSAATTTAPSTTAEPTVEPAAAPVAPARLGPVTEHHGLAPAEELPFAQRVLAELVAKQNYGYAWADPSQVQETVDVATSATEAVAARQDAYRTSAGTGPDTAYQLDEQFIGVPTVTYDADFLPVRIVGTVGRTSVTPTDADQTSASPTGNAADYQVYVVNLVWTQVVAADGSAVGAWVYDAVTS